MGGESTRFSIVRVLVAMLAVFALPGVARAQCECAPTPDVEDAYAFSAAVFVGRALEDSDGNSASRQAVELQVLRVWKGTAPVDQVWRIVTGPSAEGNCGYAFRRGERYVVYARQTATVGLFTNRCTRTQPSAGAAREYDALGEVHTPVVIAPEEDHPLTPFGREVAYVGCYACVHAASRNGSREPWAPAGFALAMAMLGARRRR